MDEIYDQLFKAYKTNYKDFLEQANEARRKISQLRPEAPEEYRRYPKLNHKDFYASLLSKKEFFRSQLEEETPEDYDTAANEKCAPGEFKLTHNQKFIKNFMSPLTPYNGLLLFHSVGVGKTCSAISIAEQYLMAHPDKHVIVLLSSNIKDNFKKQLFDITKYNDKTGESAQCTGTKYPEMVIDRKSLSPAELNKRIEKLIRERYQFIGFQKLANYLQALEKQVEKTEKNPEKYKKRLKEKIREVFSNRLIIIDEAQNLRMPSEKGGKRISSTLTYILKHSENTKLVMLTATPMFNSAQEIKYLLELLHLNDKRELELDGMFKDGVLTKNGAVMLKKACKGYISYMTSANPFSFPFRLSPKINKDPKVKTIDGLDLVLSPMSPHQQDVYMQLKDEFVEGTEEENERALNDLSTMQVSNIVYPVAPYYGEDAFDECFVRKGKTVKYIKRDYGEFLRYDEVGKYSPKIKSILDYVIKSKGIVFIYSQYISSGIYPLALALEHIGFRKYNTANLGSNFTVDNKFDTAPSYIILSRDPKLSANNNLEIAAAKAFDNLNGEQIKVVIVSKVGTEGIDFKRIREVHILEPWFNLNRIEQVVGRAVRTCSHIDLPKEERNVTIYMHACTSKQVEAIDVRTYKLAARKQTAIAEVEKILQESAIDCNLNIKGLQYPAARLNMHIPLLTSQGTRIAKHPVGQDVQDALKCEPTVKVSAKDTTTFHPLFIVDDIDLYKRYVAKLYQHAQQYTFPEIFGLLQETYTNIDEEILAYTLQEMIDTKTKFANGMNRMGYLQYRGTSYIFQDVGHHETRLSLEERMAQRKASKIEMMPLFENERKETPKRETKVTVDTMEKLKGLKDIFVIPSIPHTLDVLDAIIDRLEPVDMQYLMLHPDADPALSQALKSSPYIVDGKYIRKGADLLDLQTLNPVGLLTRNRLVLKEFKEPEKYYGFMKDGHFKVKDSEKPTAKGFICHQTSSFPIKKVIEKINELYPGLVPENAKVSKPGLCLLYELALRNKNLFARKI